jgi:ABC-type antimicrobial peptide transport system ATPase subunit
MATSSTIDMPVPFEHIFEAFPTVHFEHPCLLELPAGCVFYDRCLYAIQKYREVEPELAELSEHIVSCHYADELNFGCFK